MTGKLFLAGGGNGKQSFEVDKIFLRRIKTILYIPVAWKNEDYAGCLDWFTNIMSQHKSLRITMLTDLSKRVCLQDYDAVYIGGGNTYKLLKKLRDSKFDRTLLKYYQNGGRIYGGSAGAIIWGRDISSASRGINSDTNDIGLDNLIGLNVLNGTNIQCHYQKRQLKEEQTKSRATGIRTFAIPEESALLVEDKKLTVLGTKPITLISPKKVNICLPGKIIIS